MLVFFISCAALAAPANPTLARADDAIAPETVVAVKAATVFIRVEGNGWATSGSGFVIAADARGALIATNHHVAIPTSAGAKQPTITVVFDSGTKTERAYTAVIAGSDTVRDLAVLRVAEVKDPPAPIAFVDPPKLVETMQVYTFGFPFGKALATDKGNPAVTVGKASISSLRTGADGELSVVQIDGNLNPGNSGGPVVDAKGRLVGVAVATIRDGQGIGLTVPAAELGRMMQGRIGRVRVILQKKADGSEKKDAPVTVRIEADLVDPVNNLRGATAHYVLVAPKTKRPEADALDKHPGSKALVLKIEKGTGSGEFTVPVAEGEVLVQVMADAGGKTTTSRVRVHPLTLKVDLSGPPPAGWKEYTPADKTFVAWLPEKPVRQADEARAITVNGQRIHISTVIGRTDDGLSYEAQSIILSPALARVPPKDLYDMFRKAIVAEMKGRLTESKEAQMGMLPGVEAVIESGNVITRARIFVSGARVFIVQVTGAVDQAAGPDGETILSAFRLPGAVAKVPNEVVTPGKEPTVIAGGNNPLFKDIAPEGGLLIGLEIGVGKFGKDDVIQAARPIYRTGGKETLGEQRGTNLTRVTILKAKDGYAVGAVTYRFGLNFDGCSLTFMKVVDGKLDPKDSYESEWVGYVGIKKTAKLGGDGTPIVGLAGRATDKQLHGLGPLFKGQEAFEPKK
ncbi:MAG: serine protease [Planctomycetes bacterium]|nr:serine protease [Planctomycetota bacterium]